MARGEPAPRGARGPGVAIFVVFGVVCLAATLLVVWTTNACEGCTPWSFFGPAVTPPPEPFAGAQAALVPLRSRDCPDAAGAPPPGAAATAYHQSQLAAELGRRGYVEAGGAWSDSVALPIDAAAPDALAGTCGVIAVVAEPGGAIVSTVRDAERVAACGAALATVAVCGAESARVEGSGMVRTRAFAYPGVTPDLAAATGMPLEALLAHAEAERHLRSLGWGPTDEVIVAVVAAPSGGSTAAPVTHPPPLSPANGCTPWVAVGLGLGHGSATWPGWVPDADAHPSRFVSGAIECAASAGTPGVTVQAIDDATPGGRIYWRPFGGSAGPTLPGAPEETAIEVTQVRVVEARAATLPAPLAPSPVPAP